MQGLDETGDEGERRLQLYPPIEPFMSGRLKVGDGHEIYYEQCGNPKGEPVILLHGGPGGGSSPLMRRYHDPQHYRIVLFDQRGCGRSTPHASVENNTTWHLVADVEQLRNALDLGPVQLFGGSWGSTLALTYAISYPEHVSSLILRGIFLLRQREIDWFYRDGCNWLYPEAYEAFRNAIPRDERDDLIAAYHRRLMHGDRAVQLAAAKAWSIWEGATLSMSQNPQRLRAFAADRYALAFARIECHYFVNRGFFSRDDYILHHIDRLKAVPATIVQGRYDVITPVRNAYDLHKAWSGSTLRVVADAGHAMSERGTISELVAATRRHRHLHAD
ncbi:MAG: prolyl aminopeptidase [Pseudomonadota bacterium]